MPDLDADVFILCGGLGTRLGAAAAGLPKPMVDVGGRPFLEFLIGWAGAQGARRFVLCAGYRAEAIARHFRGRPEVRICVEESPLGTGGALKKAEPLCESADLILLNGDSWCDLDLRGLLALRRGRGALGAVAAVAADGRRDVGVLRCDASGRVLSFVEKGAPPGPADLVNAGVYAFDRRVFGLIPPGRSSLESQALPALLGEGLYVYPAPGRLWDIGTSDRLDAFRARGG